MTGDPAVSPAVTITTVLYNSVATLGAYADGVAQALEDGVVHVIAVDNASPDASGQEFRRLLPRATLLQSPVNGGFAAGCNMSWPLVESRYWLLLNPDVEPTAEGLATLAEWMDEHPRVAIASPALRGADGRLIPVVVPHDTLWRPLLEAMRLHKLIPEPHRSRLLLSGRRRTPAEGAYWVQGAAMMVRCDALKSVGLMDESFFMYGEEREWCRRIVRSGWSIGFCAEVEFTHAEGESAKRTWGDAQRIRHEVEGHIRATRRMRGRAFARMLALCLAVTLWAEAADPRRSSRSGAPEQRMRARFYSRAFRRLPNSA